MGKHKHKSNILEKLKSNFWAISNECLSFLFLFVLIMEIADPSYIVYDFFEAQFHQEE